METSIKAQKMQHMKKKFKRAQFIYNIILYSLSFCITCLFFSYPIWYSSMQQFLISLPNNISLFFNAKCFFILSNIIILILISESRMTQSSHPSPASDIYDEYVARSRVSYAKASSKIHVMVKEDERFMPQSFNFEKKRIIEEKSKIHVEKEEELMGVSKGTMDHHLTEKKRDMKMNCNNEEKKKMKKKKKELINVSKSVDDHHEEKRTSDMGINYDNVEKKKELSVSKSMMHIQEEEKKMNGMRKSKSEIWGGSEIVKKKRSKENRKEEDRLCTQTEELELNKRVEAFIARVNKQRLLEAN